jgi:flagellar protein FliS
MIMEKNAKQYLASEINTAPKELLLIMLFDGAIQFCEQAKIMNLERKIEESHNLLIRAQKIVLELMNAMDKSMPSQIYGNLMGLYQFVYLRLIRANVKGDNALVDESLVILRDLRDTWHKAMDKIQEGKNVMPKADSPGRTAPVMAKVPSLNVQG